MLRAVRLEGLLEREAGGQTGLDCRADWASILSLGEQQRLAFTRQASTEAHHRPCLFAPVHDVSWHADRKFAENVPSYGRDSMYVVSGAYALLDERWCANVCTLHRLMLLSQGAAVKAEAGADG